VKRREALVRLPVWGRADARALLLLLLLVPAVFVLPFRNLGAQDADGNRFYRAYFTADFIWHTALTAELTKYEMPPINPYLGDRTIQYYWTYFLVPAVIANEGPPPLRDVETVLKLNALCSGLLFVGSLILVTWSASLSVAGTVFAVILAVVAASAEGLYASWDLASAGRPLAGLTNLNIDAISAWEFSGLRIDSLVRSMWYNPQHSVSAALGMLALPVAGNAGVAVHPFGIVIAGLALAFSTMFNPLIGALFSIVYGIVIAADAIARRQFAAVLRHAAAALLVGVAIAWCIANDMVEGAAGVVLYGLGGYARNAPIATMMVSLGPLLLPAVLSAWLLRDPARAGHPMPENADANEPRLPRRLWPSIAGTLIGFLVFYLLRLSVEGSWFGFRAGQLLQLALPGLAGALFGRLWLSRWRVTATGFAAVFILIGLPTTVIDVYNAQDIGNRRVSPGGFRWTITLTPEEQEAYRWIRTNTPPDAIVQMDPIAHARETWSQLPTFAWRRMAAGRPISLMNIPDYDERSRRAHRMYASKDAAAAAALARELRIDYIFVGPDEQRANPAGSVAKFASRPDLFSRVFANDRTAIYEVLDER
jgi:hypothetical protein